MAATASASLISPAQLTITGAEFAACRERVDESYRALELWPPDGEEFPEPAADDVATVRAWASVRVVLFEYGFGDRFELRSVTLHPSGAVDAQIGGEGFASGTITFGDTPEGLIWSWVMVGQRYGVVKTYRLRGDTAARKKVTLNVLEPYWHPPLAPERRQTLERLQTSFAEVYPLTAGEWEESFRRTLFIETELSLWLGRADAYAHFTASEGLSTQDRANFFRVICEVSHPLTDPLMQAKHVSPRLLPGDQVRAVAAYYRKRRFPW